MPKLNLLNETDNVRNRLRPKDTKPWYKKQKFIAPLALLGAVVWWFFPSYPEKIEIPPRPVARATKPVSPQKPLPGASAKEEKATPVRQEPAKIVDSDPAPEPKRDVPKQVTTRPVAAAATPPVIAVASKARWQVRFGVFVYEENSKRLAATLGKKGIEAMVKEGSTSLMTLRVIFGPWPTDLQAKEAKKNLEKAGISASRFMAGSKRYLSSSPLRDAAEADAVRRKGIKLGYRADTARKKETRRVYKVYKRESYQNKKAAVTEQKRLTRLGVENVIERTTRGN